MRALAAQARSYWRFARGLRSFLRHPITVDQARGLIQGRLESRGEGFLALMRRAVFGVPGSPYRSLLEQAQCGLDDLERAVRARGVEATLRELAAAGVYVSFEEFKGRTPIVRGGREIPASYHDFDNPFTSASYETTTGGSTGAGVRVATDLDHIAAHAPHVLLTRHAHGVLGVPMAIWRGTLPDPTGVGMILRAARGGHVPERWFTPFSPGEVHSPLRHRAANLLIVHAGRASGVRIPKPEPLPLEQAWELARWAREAAARAGGCLVGTTVSLALRVSIAAQERGWDLEGVAFTGGSEPPTPAKVAAIVATGARWIPVYFTVETGAIGLACARPVDGNDLHLASDSLALIQRRREVPGHGPIDSFCFTSLLPSAPKILLNVESDDFGVVESRACGCELERLGLGTHLREIRSFGKLTGEGVTLVGSEMTRILHQLLPERFGGTALDYQLVEHEDERALSRLTLVIHPRVEIEDERAVVEAVLAGLGAGGLAGDLAQALWRQAETLRIERSEPVWTARGKLPTLRRLERHAAARATRTEA